KDPRSSKATWRTATARFLGGGEGPPEPRPALPLRVTERGGPSGGPGRFRVLPFESSAPRMPVFATQSRPSPNVPAPARVVKHPRGADTARTSRPRRAARSGSRGRPTPPPRPRAGGGRQNGRAVAQGRSPKEQRPKVLRTPAGRGVRSRHSSFAEDQNEAPRAERAHGQVVEVVRGASTPHIKIDIGGGGVLTVSITNEAVSELKLVKGDMADAVIKPSD